MRSTWGAQGLCWGVVVGWAVFVLACSGGQHVSSADTTWYEVRFTSGALSARRKSGAAWHTRPGDDSSELLGGLLGLAIGYPDLGFALGSAMSTAPADEAPAPYLLLKIAGDTYRISPTGRSLSPTWTQPIAIPANVYPARTLVLLQVIDAVDSGLLGQVVTNVGDLLRPGARTLSDVGEVASLDLEVRARKRRPSEVVDLFVSAEHKLDALRNGADPRWAPVPVWNGDHVTIHATGRACPSPSASCFGPEGAEPGRWASYNYSTFSEVPHASLVALLPSQALRVGAGLSFVVRESGFLLLFVNDTDVGNNTGGFAVEIQIAPP